MSAAIERPAEFDARVMQYLPGLKKLARKFTRSTEDRDDLVTDTVLFALRNWQSFREDGGFWLWLSWNMRGIASERTRKSQSPKHCGKHVPFDPDDPILQARLSTAPVQDVGLHLEQAVRLVADIRHGDVLLRVANGETLASIAAERGLSKQRLSQMLAAARDELEKRS